MTTSFDFLASLLSALFFDECRRSIYRKQMFKIRESIMRSLMGTNHLLNLAMKALQHRNDFMI